MFKMENREPGVLKQALRSSKFCPIHPDKAVFARGLCKNCYNKWLIEHNPKYAENQKKNCRQWSVANKERKKEVDKKWVAKQDENYHRVRRLRFYGLTLDDYNFMLNRQNGVCAICGRPPKEGKPLHIDHDHKTGMIRGLLCFRCNFGLSYFGEDEIKLKKAFEYLSSAGERGIAISEEIERRINIRETEKQQKLVCVRGVINKQKTRFISDTDAEKIRKRYSEIRNVSQVSREFPMYSRSAISRKIKGIK